MASREDWQFWGSEPRLARGWEDLRDGAGEASLGSGLRFAQGGQVRVDAWIKRLCFWCQFRTG